ncbi:glycoside hydrolase family 38 C-terminal domain-containing protein [Nakamurella sp. PAMC28650]|uniref:alpha-mannosidase n=1 Tax=Nakamurella sp. PAMC28650 TaxID=2762325 RepID=UPI00164E72DE|nr:alpha-mannosidase [Nakamurella sp. PAMC28650]
MHDRTVAIQDRLTRVLTERIRPCVYTPVADLQIEAWHVGGGQGEPVPPEHALVAAYEPFAVGQSWGPAWGTSWFHLTGTVPPAAAGRVVEAVVDLGWTPATPGFQAEGLVFRSDGSGNGLTVVKGLNPRNSWIPLADPALGGERIDLHVEAAANPIIQRGHQFRPTVRGEKSTAGTARLYRLAKAEIAVLETDVWELVADLEVLDSLMRSLAAAEPRRFQILHAIERALDRVELDDVVGSAGGARSELATVLAAPAGASAHRISAIGHAHIDSAWLWPVRETIRKVARTTSNVVQLLDTHPDLVYAMSSAQQYEWLEHHRPELFARVAAHVRAGRFVPVGGMWVESDTNMVGGEAMARQFSYGKRYFLDRFDVECGEVWLPDSFGYTAALPQIAALAGCSALLTQKISWNTVNTFPHHTFWWEGIDGTRVFTHFPPVDTYNAELSGAELAHAVANFREKGRAGSSLVPFGWGDGGGGPTREMIARARRTADLEGSPRVRMQAPSDFFREARAEYPSAPVWAGELYLEIHRGTYTSQAKTKQGNRRSEHLLREAELWSATASVRGLLDYPYEALDRIWKIVLLQQFHDILPGSSIAWVHREAVAAYAGIATELNEIIDDAIDVLSDDGHEVSVHFNAGPFARDGIPAMAAGPRRPPAAEVSVAGVEGDIVLDNGSLRVVVDAAGLISSVRDLAAGREILPTGARGNLLQLHPDFPNQWDAWDLDEHYRNTVVDLVEVDDIAVATDASGSVTVRVARNFGASRVIQDLTLSPGSRQIDFRVDVAWHEREKLLKVAFPVDVHTDHARFEIQFGHLTRPTHQNTSWDAARFEVCAHRWVQVGEPGYGVAVVNDSTYGHDVTRHARLGGGSTSTVRLSLLRAPRFPDPDTDQGDHVLRYALVAGAGVPEAAAAGYAINLPLRRGPGSAPVDPLVRLSGPGTAVVEAVKLADDRSGDVIVRLYEPLGGRSTITLSASFRFEDVIVTDLLERAGDGSGTELDVSPENRTVGLHLRPFQIVTLRLVGVAGVQGV